MGRVPGKSNKYSTDDNSFLPSLPPLRKISNVHKTGMLKVEMVSSQYFLPESSKVTDEIMNKKCLKGSN